MPKSKLPPIVPRDVLGALESIGIDATQSGDEAKALCPNPDHDDSSPSWSCNLDTGQHHCFACGFGGSFAYLVGKMLGLTGSRATQWVRERKLKDVAEGFTGPRPKVQKARTDMSEASMWKFTDPPASALADRRLTAEACRAYGVRWDNDRDLWITPVRDPETGRLWGWQEKNARVFRNHPVDIAKSRALFGLESLRPGGTAVVVESPLDVPYLYDAGIDGAVSGFGVSISDRQISLIRDRAAAVVLAFDNDVAGWKGVLRVAYAFGTTPVRVFDYGNLVHGPATVSVPVDVDGRDPGNLSDVEISWGIDHAISPWRLRIPWL